MESLKRLWAISPDLKLQIFKCIDETHDVYNLALPSASIETVIGQDGNICTEKQTETDEIFGQWRESVKDILLGIDSKTNPKELIRTTSVMLLHAYEAAKLLDNYDVYDCLMNYWNAKLQDDVYVIKASGYEAGREIEYVYAQKKAKDESGDTITVDDTSKVKSFDEKTARRDTLYGLTASLSRSFANCCDRLVSDYGYTEEDVEHLRREISGYNKIKEMIKLASCDYIDLKPYEADMRYILDTYIRAEETKVVSELGNMSIVELLLQGKTTTPADLVKDLPGDNEAKAETIDNNLQHEIVKKMSSNPVYYGKLSEMLKKIIMQRKVAAMSYQEYLKQVVEMAEAILHPEDNGDYPDEVKNSAARRALFDYFEEDLELTVDVDGAIRIAIRPAWKKNRQKQQKIRLAIYEKLLLHSYSKDKAEEETNQVFDIAQRQEEYDA